MNKKHTSVFLKRITPRIITQSLSVVISVIGGSYLMTWLIVDVANVKGTYLTVTYESLGVIAMLAIVLTFTNIHIYRKRVQEINTLSYAISRVAKGDFHYRIPIKPREPYGEIYEDFNKMIAELSGVQLLRNDFINSYSHEFKTPIASINGFAELLLERDLSPSEQRQYLEIIRDESQRLSSLAKNTILLSKLTSQQIITDTEHYNLGEQLRQCAIILSRSWEKKGLQFFGEFPDVDYEGNRELMQHLWLNLLGNAIKFTPAGGSISAEIRVQGNQALITVKDTGIGMTEEAKAHLFTPYYQGDPSRATQGLGLGLSIAHRIAELSGGTISVESTLGKGSSFLVALPLHHEVPAETSLQTSIHEAMKHLKERTSKKELSR